MKKLRKTIKWTVITLLVIIGGLAIIVVARQDIKYEAPYPNITASTDSAIIARGKHLVYSSAHCIDCHNKQNSDSLIHLGQEVPLSGGVVFELPLGKIYSKNITPDKSTGIGSYSDGEIARALRYGVHPNGIAVFDFMPFHNTSDEDLTAIISYLRAQKPVNNKVPNHELNAIGMAVNAFMIKPVGPTGEVPKSVERDTTAVYGKYLALSVAQANSLVNLLLVEMKVMDLLHPTLHPIQAVKFLTGARRCLLNVFVWVNSFLKVLCPGTPLNV